MDGASSGRSLWTTEELPAFPSVDRDLEVDVLILGGGLTGVSAAYQLTRAGLRVALVERHRLGTGDSRNPRFPRTPSSSNAVAIASARSGS